MKHYKNLIVILTIIILCVASFSGCDRKNKTTDKETSVISTDDISAETILSPVPSLISPTLPAIFIKNGLSTTEANNFTGKSEEVKQAHIKDVMAKSAIITDQNPMVGIGLGSDFAATTADAIAKAGGLKDIVKNGDVVLIKPNICEKSASSGSPQITDYRVVQEIVRIVKECGASKVVIAEGNFASNAFENTETGYSLIEGVSFFSFNDCAKEDSYELKPENSLIEKSLFIPKIYMDADVVITVPKLKTHHLSTISLGIKNSIGVPSSKIYGRDGAKLGLHDLVIYPVMVNINKIRKPDFVVIDGIIGGEGRGPSNNTPVASNIIIAGRDIVAVDSVGMTFMGFQLNNIYHIKLASESGLGISDLNKINVIGADLNSIKMNFKLF